MADETHTNGANGTAVLDVREMQRQYEDTVDLLQERLAELELSQEDAGWRLLGAEGNHEFSRRFLKQITSLSRLMFLKSPLINRAVTLQGFYVFGQGINIQAATPEVNDVVQAFMEDPKNKAELTSQQARTAKESTLQIDGNLFFVLFTNRTNGRVRVRTIPVDEVLDIVTNPEDAREHWYYRREWNTRTFDPVSGTPTSEHKVVFYPDWRYRPTNRPTTIAGEQVAWDTPVYHVKVGGLDGMRFGVPETYAALDWARAYKSFLEDWATITRAYSRFAWKVTTPGGARGVAAAKAKLGTTLGSGNGTETNPPPVTGSTFVAAAGSGVDMTPLRTAGATTSASDGRQLLLMVAAATGMPEFFFGDANVGNHATAKTLDRPTELKFLDRQTLWADIHQDILQYVVDQSALAPRGKLKGGYAPVEPGDDADPVVVLADVPAEEDKATGKTIREAGPMDRGIDVDFPPILEHSVEENIAAIVQAATLTGHPPVAFDPKTTTRMLLQVLGVEDIDEKVDAMYPEVKDGEDDPFSKIQPPKPPAPPPGQQSPPNGQQQPGQPRAQQQPPAAPPAQPAPQPAREAATGDALALDAVHLDALALVGPEDAQRAARLWREANPDELTDLLDAQTEGE
jgi:hypothetical protein